MGFGVECLSSFFLGGGGGGGVECLGFFGFVFGVCG